MLYAMQYASNGLIKFGSSWNPVARMKHLAAEVQSRVNAADATMRLIAVAPGSRTEEHELHRRLRRHLARWPYFGNQEWYHPTPEVLAVLLGEEWVEAQGLVELRRIRVTERACTETTEIAPGQHRRVVRFYGWKPGQYQRWLASQPTGRCECGQSIPARRGRCTACNLARASAQRKARMLAERARRLAKKGAA